MQDRFRVLVIDDDPGVRDYMEALVSRQGYQVFAVADGEQALASLDESKPDLVTLDVVLPGMDGLATLGALKQRLPDVPVVMLSGHGQARNIETGTWSGDWWIVESGLQPGDRIVVDGVQKAAPGRPVRPVVLADSAAADSAQGGSQ